MPKPIATAGGGLSDNNEWERGEILCTSKNSFSEVHTRKPFLQKRLLIWQLVVARRICEWSKLNFIG